VPPARRHDPRVTRASDPTGPGRLAVGIPLLLHRAGVEPCSGPGGWRGVGSRQAYRHSGAARHGVGEAPQFRRYHEVLGRARWDARAVARRLLVYVLDRLLPSGPVVIGIDDTIERRWGARIKARGIYRDPVRSSKGHFVKTSGLRWLSLMVVVPISWSGRHWALPFLTVLAPSARWSEKHRKRHKTLSKLGFPQFRLRDIEPGRLGLDPMFAP
jgi:hypothetical protein